MTINRWGPGAGARAVVLVLHGGTVTSTAPGRRGPAWARMLPFALGLARATRGERVAVWLLRYRVRGWNGPARDPVHDARAALAEARRVHPGAPVVLVGHSMGGRTALYLADDNGVAAVCALAPWIEPGDPEPAGGAQILIAHGDLDRTTDPAVSRAFAGRVGATYIGVAGETHALLRHPLVWQRLVIDFVRKALRLS